MIIFQNYYIKYIIKIVIYIHNRINEKIYQKKKKKKKIKKKKKKKILYKKKKKKKF